MTSTPRTVFDLGAVVSRSRLHHIVQTALRDGSLESADLIACFDANARRGVNGVAKLRPVLASVSDEPGITDSALEDALIRLLAAHGITGFERNFRPPWFDGIRGTVDFGRPRVGHLAGHMVRGL